jgi:uncharacterized delta-60 repeat protein
MYTASVRALTAVTLALGLVLINAIPARAVAGDLDQSFGGDGRVRTPVKGYSVVWDVAAQPDGRIVVGGETSDPRTSTGQGAGVVRYLANGSLDPTFSGDGRAMTRSLEGRAMALQSDGAVVVAGTKCCDVKGRYRFAVARFTSGGVLDPTFSGDGVVYARFAGEAYASGAAVDAAGRILVAGLADGPTFSLFGIMRFLPDGMLDPSFGGDGKVTTPFPRNVIASDIVVQSDGRIVVVGGDDEGFVLARYLSDGSLDSSFGGDGKVRTDLVDGNATSVALQADGRIVVAGFQNDRFAVARYTSQGAPDPSFGGGDGIVLTSFSGLAFAFGVAVQSDGRIVVVGFKQRSDRAVFAAVRYTASGGLDASFGGDGRVTTPFSEDARAHDVAIQGDGGIVAAGNASATSGSIENSHFAVVRYLPN